MLISIKKYAYSTNKLISIWIDDLTFFLFDFFQRWSSKSHVNCDFFAFLLINSNFIYFFFSFSFSSFFEIFLFHRVYYDIFDFNDNLYDHLYVNQWNFLQRRSKNSLKKLFEKLFDEKFSRFACLFHFEIEFMTKNTCFEHMRQSNMHAKNAYSK